MVVLSGGEATGTLLLHQKEPPYGEVEISGSIFNLTTGIHGFHIHTLGVLDGGCGSTGGHYNPYKVRRRLERGKEGKRGKERVWKERGREERSVRGKEGGSEGRKDSRKSEFF